MFAKAYNVVGYYVTILDFRNYRLMLSNQVIIKSTLSTIYGKCQFTITTCMDAIGP